MSSGLPEVAGAAAKGEFHGQQVMLDLWRAV